MTRDFDSADAILFDYGNTLIAFGSVELERLRQGVVAALERHGPVDPKRFEAVRDRQMSAPYENGFHENDFTTLSAELLSEVVGVEATAERVEEVVSARCAAFFDAVRVDVAVHGVLERLRARRRLALVSNYPCATCIRDTLAHLDLARWFDTVVVSADVGWCKPHAQPFQTALDALGVSPERAVFVGDNWLADIQGAKRLGMRAVLTEQFVPYQRLVPRPGDFEPDARIATLRDIEELL